MLRFIHSRLIQALFSIQRIPETPPPLKAEHIDGAQLLVNREALLRELPVGGTVMECGVDEGLFSRQILEITKPHKLLLVDLWGDRRFNTDKLMKIQSDLSSQIESGQVQIERQTSVEALEACEDGSLDWIYIDTDHSYSTTQSELKLAAQKVKASGYICGHDYTIGSWPSYHRYGVIEAVNRFCVEQNWKFAYLTHEPNRNLSFALTSAAFSTDNAIGDEKRERHERR
ncbi:MAG: class I SAM-dependent methyltransferase [Planctomycetota bacterium]|nr:class I SAM-dependent methyltransferase [Planctomycetota bacterium]